MGCAVRQPSPAVSSQLASSVDIEFGAQAEAEPAATRAADAGRGRDLLMDRRGLIGALVLGILSGPRVTSGGAGRKVYRIGILNSSGKTSDLSGLQTRSRSLNALLSGLQELGYVYGRDFVTEPRGGESKPERFPRLAAELVRLQVDVIVSSGPTLPALKQATSTIPVVMASAGGDAVAQGFARSLARPGGNFTGISGHGTDLTVKQLELLKELIPTSTLVAVVWARLTVDAAARQKAVDAAAHQRGWKLMSLEIRDHSDLEGAFRAATNAGAGALVITSTTGGLLVGHSRRVAELAAKNRLPAAYHLRLFVDAGGLISYGTDIVDIWRRAAVFIDKILKGAKPADLPIEQPDKFELVINIKAAGALGLTIPQPLLLRADEVIK